MYKRYRAVYYELMTENQDQTKYDRIITGAIAIGDPITIRFAPGLVPDNEMTMEVVITHVWDDGDFDVAATITDDDVPWVFTVFKSRIESGELVIL